jgi:hypothetical protein
MLTIMTMLTNMMRLITVTNRRMCREKTRTVWEERYPGEPFHLPLSSSLDKEHRPVPYKP